MKILTVLPVAMVVTVLSMGCKSPLIADHEEEAFAAKDVSGSVSDTSSGGAFASIGDLLPESPTQVVAAGHVATDHPPAANYVTDDSPIATVSMVSAVKAPQPLRTLKSNENLNDFVDSAPGVVLLDFYADWCGPCKKQSVILHEIEDDARAAKAQIIKVDFDQHEDLAKRFKVRSLPTLVVLKDGKVVQKKVGYTQKNQVLAMLR
ncbi:MAG: thioredoxin family protein [Rubripirellula sp.]